MLLEYGNVTTPDTWRLDERRGTGYCRIYFIHSTDAVYEDHDLPPALLNAADDRHFLKPPHWENAKSLRNQVNYTRFFLTCPASLCYHISISVLGGIVHVRT